MTTESELIALAGKLTKAQISTILEAKQGLVAGQFWFPPMLPRTRKSLERRGLAEFHAAPDRLSELALRLRKHLRARAAAQVSA